MASITASPASVVQGSAPSGPGWSNPGNATTNNDSFAVVVIDAELSTQYLEATNFDFSSIPVGATIDGILTTVYGKVADGVGGLGEAAYYRAGGGDWFNLTDDFTVGFTASETAITAGWPTELAGQVWTRSDILDSSFGVRFWATSNGVDTAIVSVDSISLTVYFTPSGGTAVANKTVGVFQAINRASTY